MAWPEVSIEDLPPQRDDEPASLRKDILDELTDHFTCALNRELLKNSDEQLARQRVLNQFGDPIKIARQLWFDAMKEKIMSQKIMTGVSVVVAVCSIAVVGIAWMLMRDSQGVNREMLAQLAAIANRPQPVAAVNIDQQLIKKLDELKLVQRDQVIPVSEELNQISFQLVQENNIKKPAVGFSGKLTKNENQTDTFTVDSVSNKTGKLNFGKLPSGKYHLKLSAPWGETYHQLDLNTVPGRDYSQTISCPSAAPEQVPVKFQVNWSDKLKSEDWYLICDFRESLITRSLKSFYSYSSIRNVGEGQWFTSQNQQQKPTGVYIVDSNNMICVCPLGRDAKFEAINLETLELKPSIKVAQGEYTLQVLYLVPKTDLSKLSDINSLRKKHIIMKNRTSYTEFDPTFHRINRVHQTDRFGNRFFGYRHQTNYLTTLLLPFNNSFPSDPVIRNTNSHKKLFDGCQLPELLKFTATKNQQSLWKIKLPEMENIKNPNGTSFNLF